MKRLIYRTLYIGQVFVFGLLISGCGKVEVSSDSESSSIPAQYLHLHKSDEFSSSPGSKVFDEVTADLNRRLNDANHTNEDYLYSARADARQVRIELFQTREKINARTSCDFAKNSCLIQINTNEPLMNYDPTASESQRNLVWSRIISVYYHELGHAFGVGHFKDYTSIMYYTVTLKNEPKNEKELGEDFESSLSRYIQDLNRFRINGASSGIPDINVK